MSSYIKKIFIGLAAIIVSFSFLLPQEETKVGPNESTLVVGLESSYPPFEFLDQEGKLIGFDIELAELIAARLGKKLVIKVMEFESEILSLKQGTIDLIISGMSIIPSRLKEINMIPYHGEKDSSFSLIFWNKIPDNVSSLQDLITYHPESIVSVESGSTAELYLKQYPSLQTKSFQGSLAPLMDIKYGKSIANLVASDVAYYLSTQHPSIKILSIPISKEDDNPEFGIGIKKGNIHLYEQVSQIILDLQSSGVLSKLEAKWFKKEEG